MVAISLADAEPIFFKKGGGGGKSRGHGGGGGYGQMSRGDTIQLNVLQINFILYLTVYRFKVVLLSRGFKNLSSLKHLQKLQLRILVLTHYKLLWRN
jgi:hypothetical protein